MAGPITGSCHCVDVEPGTYDNQVSMLDANEKWVCIDTCIATAIGWLWHHDVVTLNSCCGHGRMNPTVIVAEESIARMLELGFVHDDTPCVVPDQLFRLDRPRCECTA